MKRVVPLLVVLILAAVVVGVGCNRHHDAVEPIVWYGIAPHPYINEVKGGAEAYAKDANVPIYITIGQEWSQNNETNNIESLSTKGYKGVSLFPGDPDGVNDVFRELRSHDQYCVAYGAEPNLPTPASFTVATDIKGAAAMACEKLIATMGDKGNILNVLETVTDVNTKKRNDAVQEVVAKHPNVHIIQTINDMTAQDVARNKIESTMASLGDQVDGIITTGYNPTVAAAGYLSQRNSDKSHKYIHFVGIDTDKTVIDAIRGGTIDATIAQNPFGHGYVSCAILKMIVVDGYKPVQDYQFINAGAIVVTKDNVDTYPAEVRKITDGIMADLPVKYLTKGK